jgi:hypothetical protein
VKHRLARVWARLVVTLSVCLLLAGLVAAAAVLFFDWRWAGLPALTQDARLLAAALLVLAGILLATPGILIGELLLILLAQRRLLARIDRQLRWVLELPDEDDEPGATRRLMGRYARKE